MSKYERSDVSTGGLAIFGLGLALSVLLIGLVVWIGMRVLDHTTPNGAQPDTRSGQTAFSPAPPPRLQPYPVQDLAKLRAGEEQALHSYGWVDRPSGTIHIPIERAMQLTAQPEARP